MKYVWLDDSEKMANELAMALQENGQKINDELKRLIHTMPDSNFQGDLKDFQIFGFRWLTALFSVSLLGGRVGGCVLADEMGCGKTIQTISLLSGVSGGRSPSLVIVPLSIISNWQSEFSRFAPRLDICVYVGTSDERLSLQSHIKRESFKTSSRVILDEDDYHLHVVLTTYETCNKVCHSLYNVWFISSRILNSFLTKSGTFWL